MTGEPSPSGDSACRRVRPHLRVFFGGLTFPVSAENRSMVEVLDGVDAPFSFMRGGSSWGANCYWSTSPLSD